MSYEEMIKLSDNMSKGDNGCKGNDYLHDEISGAMDHLKAVDPSEHDDELMMAMVDFFRYGWHKAEEDHEIKQLTAAGALRKALAMYEGSDLFNDVRCFENAY